MNNSTANAKQLKLPPDALLIPMAANFSGSSIFSLLVKTELEGKIFFTVLSGPDFQPSGWTEDETVIKPLIAKYDFALFAPENNPPSLTLEKTQEGKRRLEEWWKTKNIRP